MFCFTAYPFTSFTQSESLLCNLALWFVIIAFPVNTKDDERFYPMICRIRGTD